MRKFCTLCFLVSLLLTSLPALVLSDQDEVSALRRRVQELEADLIRVKADAYDRIRRLEGTTQAANEAILKAVEIVKARDDSTLTKRFKEIGFPM